MDPMDEYYDDTKINCKVLKDNNIYVNQLSKDICMHLLLDSRTNVQVVGKDPRENQIWKSQTKLAD